MFLYRSPTASLFSPWSRLAIMRSCRVGKVPRHQEAMVQAGEKEIERLKKVKLQYHRKSHPFLNFTRKFVNKPIENINITKNTDEQVGCEY